MRSTIINNNWNTTEWGLALFRVSSFPLDPSCTFNNEIEFQNYLNGQDVSKPYLGQLIAVNSDKYHIYLVQSYADGIWTAEELNKSDLDNIKEVIDDFKEKVANDLEKLKKYTEDENSDLEERLKGGVTEDFDTLKKIEDIFLKFKVYLEQNVHNLQSELDQTQVGVGLSGDGSYNADQTTNFLQNYTIYF